MDIDLKIGRPEYQIKPRRNIKAPGRLDILSGLLFVNEFLFHSRVAPLA
jgi:hypothetical protein